MISLFRQTSRQKGLKKRRGKRGRRVAQLIVPAILTTALLIPVVTTLTDGSGSSCDTASSSTASTDSTTSAGSGGGSSGSTTCVGGTGSGGTSDGSGGTTGTGSGGTGGTGGGTGSPSGSLDGFTLAFQEEPPTTTDGSSATTGDSGTATTDGSTTEITTESSSAFDDYPWADLTCIEEEWELLGSQPDALVAGPQLGTVMTCFEDADDFYFALAINHRFEPSFSAGGLEVQLWYQGQLLGWQAVDGGVLSTANETIRWTQRLEIKGGKLRFSIVQGDSTTWGQFGQGESTHLELATTLTDLNDYHPNVSIENSGVLFASNRVGSLVLKKVRGFAADGTPVAVDSDPVTVFGPPQP